MELQKSSVIFLANHIRASLDQCHQLFGATCHVKLKKCDEITNPISLAPPPSAEGPLKSIQTGSSCVEGKQVKALPPPAQIKKTGKAKVSRPKISSAYCQVCGMTLSSQAHLTAHRRKHTGENRYKCDHCSRSFWCQRTFAKHKSTSQQNGACPPERTRWLGRMRPKGAWQCNICGKKMKYPDSYEPHLKIRHGITPKQLKCGDCGKAFVRMYDLNRHRRIHQDACSCIFCDKILRDQDNLFAHLRGHTDEKPYFCKVKGCAASYRRLDHLKRHSRTIHVKRS